MTLDYNVELFPLKAEQSFALALASSLARGPPATNAAGEEEEKDVDAWRPDGKGRRGLEEDYDYVMYGKVRTGAKSTILLSCSPTVAGSYYIEGIQIRPGHCANCVRDFDVYFRFASEFDP